MCSIRSLCHAKEFQAKKKGKSEHFILISQNRNNGSMCKEECVSRWLSRSAAGAFVMGLCIGIVAFQLIKWEPIGPQCDTCLEQWPDTYGEHDNLTWPFQCGLHKTYYSTDMKTVDASATQIIGLIQLGVMAVGFVVCVLNLPPLCTAYCEKKGNQCCRRFCGFISCFATLAGFVCGVACVVLPIIAESSVKQICQPLQASVKLAVAYEPGDECSKDCFDVPVSFLNQFCGLPAKFMIITIIGLSVMLFTAMSFILNALGCCSCCLKKREKENAKVVPGDMNDY